MDLGVLEIGVWVVRAPGWCLFCFGVGLARAQVSGWRLRGWFGFGVLGFRGVRNPRKFADRLPVLRHGEFTSPGRRPVHGLRTAGVF